MGYGRISGVYAFYQLFLMPFFLSILAIIFAVTVHEYCHAWMANILGDPTGRYLGRLTLNPLAHFDIFGTLALILIGFGWGKPVPFNPANLRNPKRDAALISLAGPAANILTALVLAIPLKYLADTEFAATIFFQFMKVLFWFSVLLFSLNVLPLPPLDGSKVIGLIIPRRWNLIYQEYLTYGVKYVIFFMLFDVIFLSRAFDFSFLHYVVVGMTEWIAALISLGT